MDDSTKLLVTGASGFVGSALIKSLAESSHFNVTAAIRSTGSLSNYRSVMIGDIDKSTGWAEALSGQAVVIHTAARSHVMSDESDNPLAEYRKVNVDGTLTLARQAAAVGVRRFIFISSVKVNGEQTQPRQPFTVNDNPNPQDHYGLSKWEAEQGLKNIAEETNMELVIIRPPLVYGPQVKGNFASLLRMVGAGMPLPLGCVDNSRSLVALDNLIDLIITCINHPNAANQLFLVSDGQDLSTTELLDKLALAMCKPSWLLPIPSSIIRFMAYLLGKQQVADRLLGSLQVDISNTKALLGWSPPVTVEEGLKKCVNPN